MKKISIAPFTIREYSLIEHLESRYSIHSLISPKGIGLENQDISILKNESKKGYRFTNSIESGIKGADIVIISEVSKKDFSLYQFAIAALTYAVELGKEIYCFLDLNNADTQLDDIVRDCEMSNAKCHFYSGSIHISEKLLGNLELYKFNVPVLYVHEMVPNCDGYYVFLKLALQFRNAGKRVLAISEDKYNSLFGLTYANLDSRSYLSEQVFHLNRLVYNLYKASYPNIILIRLSNPILKYDDKNFFDCGLMAYAMAQAVPGDGSVYCSLSGSPGRDFWDGLSDSISAKFGYPILAVHISNCIMDPSSNDAGCVVHLPSDVDQVSIPMYQSRSCKFYRLKNQDEFEDAFRMINDEFFNLPYGVI